MQTTVLPASSQAPPRGYMPALDGVRGAAMLLVLVHHISAQFPRPSGALLNVVKSAAFAGWTGVDFFFVLSGSLITGILLKARSGPHYFRSFYARRTVRIFPLYYAVLILLHLLSGNGTRPYWAWYWTYSTDFLFAWKGSFFVPGHFWSLAVEEHYYLVWPAVVYYLSTRALQGVCAALIAGAFLLRLAMLLAGASRIAIYVLTFCRMDALALGSLLALAAGNPKSWNIVVRIARIALPLTAGLCLARFSMRGQWLQYGFVAQTAGYSITILLYAALVVGALASPTIGFSFTTGPLRFCGKYSYAVYVLHPFVIARLAPFFALGNMGRRSVLISAGSAAGLSAGSFLWLDGIAAVLLFIGCSIALALLSWWLLEQPCLRLKRFFPYQGRAQGGAA